ncbi:hypothetical protein AB840_15070 [Megasphaera cerevisiae DSM 20462]|uniref:HTH cro/C1-type domain-containing protein n=1 Tax=Megasphaera cerevisiae DSM 20462 TaxID=1122219 RepID=A0A0J6WRP9_9FIRM|nr:helix-turn-helix transcriptional regulator [Megasphaera cerevisiae]KMO85184.1 hypothetical protein AB840_15070 [Megasphaera cerevisiae DSM 20462]SKA27979.1 Transcriptional regulator, contains XRE-family HTH domain [Megasphaera cerevisiae DSM 20462]
MKNVQAIIKDARIKLGLTMKELADKVGVNVGTVSRWESGEVANMTRKNMVQLARALNISPMDLLDDSSPTDIEYYMDPEVAAMAEQLRTNPNGRILFDASKDLTKEDVDIVLNLINGLKAKEGKND